MGYNIKNARNEKSISKTTKLPSLRPLAWKSKFIQQFEFLEKLKDFYGNCCWRARSCSLTTFSIQIFFLIFIKIETIIKVAPYSFLTARKLISKISRWRELSNSTQKSRAESRSKMPTNTSRMASKFLKFVYRKCCVDRLRFQNIYRLNRRPYLSLLNLKEKCARYAGVPTSEADLFDRHDHWAGQSKVVYYHTYLQSVAFFVELTQKPRYESGCDTPTSLVVCRGAKHELTLRK